MISAGLGIPTSARTNGVTTSQGYLLPVKRFGWGAIRTIKIPDKLMDEIAFSESDTTSLRGKKAERIVIWFIRQGWFPFSGGNVITVEDINQQHNGIDLIASITAHIQVKCDWDGGHAPGMRGCTGNLYIEIAERNPSRSY